jgi:hypothetical protein
MTRGGCPFGCPIAVGTVGRFAWSEGAFLAISAATFTPMRGAQ